MLREGLVIAALCAFGASASAVQDEPPTVNHWTVLYYGCSDNDSEESFCPDIAQAREGLGEEDGFEVFCLVDRSPKYSDSIAGFGEDFAGTRLYQLTRDEARRLDGGAEFPEIRRESETEVDMGDAAILGKYIRWAKAHHPARRYALIFYSHGNGSSWCPDESNDGSLYPAELTDVLGPEDSLDLVVFDVCSMAGLANAYQWRPGADRFGIDVFVATPMAGIPFPWREVFSRIRSSNAPTDQSMNIAPADLTAESFGCLVVEETERHRHRTVQDESHSQRFLKMISREAMTCVDLRQAAEAKGAVDALARALAKEKRGRDALREVRGEMNEPKALSYSVPYFDVYDVAARLAQADVGDPLRRAARQAQASIEKLVITSFGLAGYEDFKPGKHGIYLLLPPFEMQPARVWGHLGWYRPDAMPKGQRGYGHYATCQDGAEGKNGVVGNWYELLISWWKVTESRG